MALSVSFYILQEKCQCDYYIHCLSIQFAHHHCIHSSWPDGKSKQGSTLDGNIEPQNPDSPTKFTRGMEEPIRHQPIELTPSPSQSPQNLPDQTDILASQTQFHNTQSIKIFDLTIFIIDKKQSNPDVKVSKIHKHGANENKPRAPLSSLPNNPAAFRTAIKRIAYKPRRHRSKSGRSWVCPPESPSLGTKETTPATKSPTRTRSDRRSESPKRSDRNATSS
jgi:hypothetical protein